MLEITVKTLDSQNHSFTCEDDITVRGFKEHIAETVSVPADSQRLIYCGRVLQDDKKLNDYGNVNGKVIHLVQRAPPQPESRNSNNGAQRQNNNHGMGQSGTQFRYRGHFPRNAMYLGAMSVPTEVVEGPGMPPPRLSNTLSNSRLEAAKKMLHKASQLMDRLDDPSVPLHPSPTENNASETNTQPQASAPQEEERESQSNSGNGSETRDRLGRTVSEIAVSFAAAHLASLRTRDNGEAQSDESQPPQSDNAEPGSEQESVETDRAEAGESETSDSRPEPSTSNNENQNGSRRSTQQVPRPPQMAQLLETLVSAQDRLRPYIDRYRVLMSADPTLSSGTGPDSVTENQRIVDGVSESLHYLSHACHALSDIIVDMGQQPPRNLRCRPIIIQHSAILQAGIPIQIEPHISITGRTAVNHNNTSDEGNEATRPSSPTPTADQANRSSSSNNQPASQNSNDQQSQSPLLGTILNLPSNLELSMEFRPQSPMDVSSPSAPDGSESEQGQTNNNNNNNNGNVGSNAGSFLMSSSNPLALIRDALQSVLNDRQIPMETSSGTSANTQSNVPYVTIVGQQMDFIMTNSGQSTQARSNIGTHPTTSTQTRSTARPHVLHPHTHMNMGMGMSQNMDFDPFLPCNSHHIRRTPAASATPTSTSQSSQTNQASESQSRTHTASFSTPSSARPQVETETFTIGDVNAARDILENDGQALATGIGLAMTLSELFQGSLNDSVHISFVGSGSGGGGGSGPAPGEINLSQNSDLPLADLLRLLNVRMEDFSDGNFLFNLWMFLLRNLTFGGMMQLSRGQPGPLISLRRPLREFLEQSFPNSSSIQEDLVEQLVSIDRPYLQNLVPEGESIDGTIDLPATVEALMRQFSTELLKYLFNNDLDDTSFAQEVITLTIKLDRQSSAVLQHVFQGQHSSLEATALRFLNQFMEGIPPFFQQTLIGMLTTRIRAYATQRTEISQEEITSLIVYKNKPPVVPAESVASTSSASAQAAVPSTSKSKDTSAHMQGEEAPTTELLPEILALPEMQGIDDKHDINNIEPVEKFVDETMDLAYGEEIPETFPGAEEFPPEWVAVMARDQVRQRKQAQLQAENGGPIPYSDAYLSILPSKRRKLIEQQKPQILVQPPPGSDSTVVQASVERLVREGICQSNLEEVEGAAQAVAAAPAVRTAFGNAIRDSIHPGRLRTPDFPNARRFPNATKYFTNGEQKDKEGSKKCTKNAAAAAATTPPTSTNGSDINK